MTQKTTISALLIGLLISCGEASNQNERPLASEGTVKEKIQLLNDQLIWAAENDAISKSMELFADDALLLPEYMPIIEEKEGIKKYYTEIYEREQLTGYQKKTEEVFNFETTILEIGTYEKTFANQPDRSGPYWNIWRLQPDGSLHLQVETFGFFKPLPNPAINVVDSVPGSVWRLGPRKGTQIPLEFDAYAALMENIVRDRDTEKVISLYTDDGSYTPFVDTTKTGIANLSKHYYAYHKNPVIIDSIEAGTYDFIPVPDGVLRISQFYVEWTVPDFSGKNEGAGISYWRRQEDNSLKIHRHIGHHIHE